VGLTSWQPEKSFEEVQNPIGDWLSDPVSSKDEEYGDNEDDDEEDAALATLSEDDEPSWVKGTISKPVQQFMEGSWPKPMCLHESMQPWWGDVANYFCESDMMHGMAEMRVPAVGQLESNQVVAWHAPQTLGEEIYTLDIVPGKLWMPLVTFRMGRCHMTQGSGNSQSHKIIASLRPYAAADWLLTKKSKPVKLGSIYPCIWPPK